ncbi:MAG: hypothetical protein JFT10_03720 [Muribaculaceae bacterium]|uniref:hypothetical protein n=1 Tax=uncultured Duncaniella sp. TaxID=2768039 RepID=UPI001A253ACE|nr:hypothetical protein [uncultured Duncaniella sp.]MBJ2189941.1 hypothetical protein [Muribaculaceae bacterium]
MATNLRFNNFNPPDSLKSGAGRACYKWRTTITSVIITTCPLTLTFRATKRTHVLLQCRSSTHEHDK